MLRVHKNHLSLISGKWLLNEENFSGLAYCFDEKGVMEELIEIKDGLVLGPSKDLLDLQEDDDLRIDLNFSDDEEEESTFFNDTMFTGAGYLFTISGILEEEALYDFGDISTTARQWFPSGTLKRSSTLKTDMRWNEDGSLWLHNIAGKNWESIFNIQMINNKSLDRLVISNDYAYDADILDEYNISNISNSLKLRGQGINDNLLSKLTLKKGFNDLMNLTFTNTSISANALLAINLKNIERLILDNNKNIKANVIAELKEKYPLCIIGTE
ncbi:hypothetical protein A9Q81_26615 [Gammaproteobacteria bacterium 42_54_T18]|nr:hypothetical protein A9Q81_26615 [Gammaproteobacteria bacterium 42_54_T18]